jgi:predicted ATP-dependent endonuclease of OLD family
MLLAFSVENFRSIKERQTLSLEATPDNALESSHVCEQKGARVLRSLAVYGPNASGKSSLLNAMTTLRTFVLSSAREGQAMDRIPVESFLLHELTEKEPTIVEWEFLWKDSRYRYGFSADKAKIHAEWLFRRRGKAKEARLFTREGQDINVNADPFREGTILKKLEKDLGNPPVRENALALSVLAQFNGQVSKEIVEWFNQLRFTSGLTDHGHFAFTAERLKDPVSRQKLLSFAQKADFNINGLSSEFQELAPETLSPLVLEKVKAALPPNTKTLLTPKINTSHPKTGADDQPSGSVQFDMEEQESQGTQKFISISGPLHHTIEEGSILIIDEFEARLHPLLTRAIFEWFHSAANTGTAQLIVATHDVGLMDPEFLRRDQVWFCEKDQQGATSLYSLAEFDSNTVRPTTKFNRQYLLGLFGSVPKLALLKEVAYG